MENFLIFGSLKMKIYFSKLSWKRKKNQQKIFNRKWEIKFMLEIFVQGIDTPLLNF